MIVFGGPPSVGSSLLVRILDRHPDISAGPETAILARTSLMVNWDKDKHLLVGKHIRKLRDHGWHRYRGTTLMAPYYPWDREALLQMINTATSYQEFVLKLEERILLHQGTKHWIEKTPSNAYNFGWLRTNMPAARLIMMVRDPYDAIASMIHRGYSVLYATAAYLLHCSAGYVGVDPNIHYLRYEDLIHDTQPTMKALCNYIGVSYQDDMLAPDDTTVQMRGWLQSESGPIGDKSINRFDTLSPTQQTDVMHCVTHLRVNDNFSLPGLSWGFQSIAEICEHWDYNLKSSSVRYRKRKHQVELYREAWIRTLSLYPSNMLNFPLSYHL